MYYSGIFILFIVMVSAACSRNDSDNCMYFERARVIEASLPDSGLVNQVIPVPIKFACINGCGQFGYFETKLDSNTIQVRVIAQYDGCVCTENAPVYTKTYDLIIPKPGSYVVKFVTDEDAFWISKILIQ